MTQRRGLSHIVSSVSLSISSCFLMFFAGLVFNMVLFTGCAPGGAAASGGPEFSGELATPNVPIPTIDTGTHYYVSSDPDGNGNDSNSGTEGSPWKTITKVNAQSLQPGDTVHFKRGDTFRGQLKPKSGTASGWISYTDYGSGNKPKILGSLDLWSGVTWTDEGSNNWSTTLALNIDIGSIFYSEYALIGAKRETKVTLSNTGDFYWDSSGPQKLYIRSSQNPATQWSAIEAAQTGHIVDQSNVSYAYFKNLHLSQGSAHGFGGGNTSHLYIKNCDFSYIGGGYLAGSEPRRYGNAIEFWGNAQYNVVDSCRAWEIYDTAYTNQNHTTTAIQNHIYYINNIAFNCGLASFEFWNRPDSSQMTNIFVDHNTGINPGHGWGVTLDRPDKNSFHIASFYSEAKVVSMSITNNIFYSNTNPVYLDNHLFLLYENVHGEFSSYQIKNNLWYMPNPRWAIGSASAPTIYINHNDFSAATVTSFDSVTASPVFTSANYSDVTAGDWSPAVGSPVIDQGVMTFRTIDAAGVTVIGTPDIGAYEKP